MDRIVLVGFKGSGKNTVGDYLVEKYGYKGISFADALKDTVAAVFCWDRQALEGVTPETRDWREQVDPWWAAKLQIPNLTPRWALMHFGTDLLRQHFNQDIWVMNVEKRLEQFADQKVVVFDGRFPNEIRAVTDNGGQSVRVKRGPEPKWWQTAIRANSAKNIENRMNAEKQLKELSVHKSEYAWIGCPVDMTITNNGTVKDLHKQIDVLMKHK